MAEVRMILALETFANIWSKTSTTTSAAFSQAFRDRLSRDPSTAWARDLDERSFAVLLWEMGEYGIRVNSSRGEDGGQYPPPTFDGPPEQIQPMRNALRLIAMIESGTRTTATEAARLISEVTAFVLPC